ncbi:hypothetical protein [Trichloromonas sp.]|uniref:hypothetical protein n=1 Tax=Trichloromonas sp. TaxID=3069249 RepID=UPI003D81A373
MAGVVALALAACGGGGGSSSGGSVPTTLTGTAAAGAPIIGTVTIKDSTAPVAKTKTVTIEADGKYTVDVSDLVAPYMVRADGRVGGNQYHLYSAATAEDVGGTINITPLTDLIVANIAGSVAQTYFDKGDFSSLTATQLKTQSDALAAKLAPILTAVGVSGSIDLLRASFSTDHTGLDAALDILRVSTDTSTNVATITNIVTQQKMTANISTGTYSGELTDTTGVATAATDIQKISSGFKKFSDLFAKGLPSETNPTLLALFDAETFLEGGQDRDSFLSEITTDPSMVGISFTNITIKSMEMATSTALVGFTVFQHGAQMSDAPEAWYMIKRDGAWYMQGDQRVAGVEIEPRAEYHMSESGNPITTGLMVDINDRGGRNITRAVVTGAGLPAGGVTLVNNIERDYFEIVGQNNGNHYAMTDAAINEIAESGEVYTAKLYDASGLVATYTVTLGKRPYLASELTVAKFPVITTPTLAELRTFVGGAATVAWTMPEGLSNDWLDVGINDNAGNSAIFEAELLPADTSKSFTLDPVTSTGQHFTVTGGWLWLTGYDSDGRMLSTAMW